MLTREIAQAVVDAMRDDVGYSLNVMDHAGRIIASFDPTRIGSTHPGAIKVLESGEAVEVTADGPGVRRGINLPIVIGGERIGVVGITGDPDEVRPLARLVRTMVTLHIEREQTLHEESVERSRRVLLTERLATYTEAYPRLLIADAAEFGLVLTVPHVAVIVRGVPTATLSAVLGADPSVFSLLPAATGFLATDDDAAAPLLGRLIALGDDVRTAIGPSSLSVEESLRHAREASAAAAAIGLRRQIVAYREVDHLCAAATVEVPGRPRAIDALIQHPELLNTLRSLVRHDGNLAETAAELCIHRNTLTYRLDRITTLTGCDPHSVLGLLELVVDLVRAQTPIGAPQKGTPSR